MKDSLSTKTESTAKKAVKRQSTLMLDRCVGSAATVASLLPYRSEFIHIVWQCYKSEEAFACNVVKDTIERNKKCRDSQC